MALNRPSVKSKAQTDTDNPAYIFIPAIFNPDQFSER